MRCCRRSFSNTSASPTITRVMPGFFSANCSSMATMRRGLRRRRRGSRSAIWLIRREDALLDELDQPLEHLRLAGEVAVQRRLAHFQPGRQRRRGDALGARLLQHGGQRLQDLHAALARLRALARRAAARSSPPGMGSGVSSSASDMCSAGQRCVGIILAQPTVGFPPNAMPTAGAQRPSAHSTPASGERHPQAHARRRRPAAAGGCGARGRSPRRWPGPGRCPRPACPAPGRSARGCAARSAGGDARAVVLHFEEGLAAARGRSGW